MENEEKIATFIKDSYGLYIGVSDLELVKESAFSCIWNDRRNNVFIKELKYVTDTSYLDFFNRIFDDDFLVDIGTPMIRNVDGAILSKNKMNTVYIVRNLEGGGTYDFSSSDQLAIVFDTLNKLIGKEVLIEGFDNSKKNNYTSILINPAESMFFLKNCYERKYHGTSTFFKRVESVLEKLNLRDYRSLPVSYSHGEFQNTNFIFTKEKNFLIDFDSFSIRPRLVDIAVSLMFFCRHGRGEFHLKLQDVTRYLSSFHLNELEKKLFSYVSLAYFIPKPFEVEQYSSYSKSSADWYLDWNKKSFEEVWEALQLLEVT
jgi:thiamine kinase-like enzyme